MGTPEKTDAPPGDRSGSGSAHDHAMDASAKTRAPREAARALRHLLLVPANVSCSLTVPEGSGVPRCGTRQFEPVGEFGQPGGSGNA